MERVCENSSRNRGIIFKETLIKIRFSAIYPSQMLYLCGSLVAEVELFSASLSFSMTVLRQLKFTSQIGLAWIR